MVLPKKKLAAMSSRLDQYNAEWVQVEIRHFVVCLPVFKREVKIHVSYFLK